MYVWKLKNEEGYALVIVLLIIVLFLGTAATFMAGSLNHAKQEVRVDTGNQAVAAAEMGTNYYSIDFEREIENIEASIKKEAEKLVSCIKLTSESCKEVKNAADKEGYINSNLRKVYFDMIVEKIKAYSLGQASDEIANYRLDSITIKQFNGSLALAQTTYEKDKSNDQHPIMQDDTTNMEIKLSIVGIEDSLEKNLTVILHTDLPKNFVKSISTVLPGNKDEETKILYGQVFEPPADLISCSELIKKIDSKESNVPNECQMLVSNKFDTLEKSLKDSGRKYDNFKVYAKNLPSKNECTTKTNCGFTIILQNDLVYSNSNNNVVDSKVIIDGTLSIGNNMNNMGKNGFPQIFVMKELDVGNNLKNMENTTFVVLGKNDATLATNNKGIVSKQGTARLYFKNHFDVYDNSKLCLDLDQIVKNDWELLQNQVNLSGNGQIIYHTIIPTKQFKLASDMLTEEYVIRSKDYNNFLNECGISVNPFLEVNPLDSGYELEVEY